MPVLLSNNKVGVYREELIPDFWPNWENLRKQITRDSRKDFGLRKISSGGNGRSLLLDYDSLPSEIQQQLPDPRRVDHILERYYVRDHEAVDFYTSFKTEDGLNLLPESQNRYIINASVMKALVQLKQAREIERSSKGGSLRGILNTLATDAETFKSVMQAKYGYTHNLPTSKRFKGAFRSFRKDGYISLIKDVKGIAKRNALKVTEETVELLNNMFAGQSNKPNPTEIHIQYNAFINGHLQVINDTTGEIYDPKKFTALSESSIRMYLTKWENQIGTHAVRNGDRQKLMTKFTPYHSFEQPTLAGSIISVDDRQPPFEYEKGKRMWFYNGIDLASEAFTVWVYGKTKEGIILEFYRQMVRNYDEWGFNLPAELECESSLNASYKDTFLKEGNMFQYRQMYANKARSKRIERYYGELRYKLEKEREGWLARPFALSESNQISNVPKMTVPYDRLAQECLKDIVTWNNMEHSKIKGKTRWEVFCENQNPDLRATNYKAILPHLGHKTGSSCNAGITRLNSRLWLLGDEGTIQTGEPLVHLMKQVEGREFDIYWLDGNDGHILKAFVYVDGRYICELLPKPRPNKAKIERTAEDEELRAIMTRYEATVNGFMRTQKNQLDTVTILDNRKKTLNNKFQIPGIEEFDPTKNMNSETIVPPMDEPTYEGEEEFINYRNPANDL
ncbi:hypothetical protein BFP77_08185 [Maribacter sp. 4U21]|uniref:hypothetical protein n=1 Tax=Maribacter sp. 4U21 TaxID=1889779 RepID=UPI000C160566|nr:hypothetical protein [Maribacter sp. 4U21]PIB28885.1 hypothetical protein BFP77_08185 [Maribacter sp. 4U21]